MLRELPWRQLDATFASFIEDVPQTLHGTPTCRLGRNSWLYQHQASRMTVRCGHIHVDANGCVCIVEWRPLSASRGLSFVPAAMLYRPLVTSPCGSSCCAISPLMTLSPVVVGSRRLQLQAQIDHSRVYCSCVD